MKQLISTFVICAGFGMHGAEIIPDSEGYARALLFFKGTKEYHGNFYGQRTNGVWSWGSFVMNKECRIVKLTIDDVEIPIDPRHPLPGLPFPDGSILNQYSVNLDAIDLGGNLKAHGTFVTPRLDESTVIRIVLEPKLVPKFVAYAVPGGTNPKLFRLVLENGQTFWYDESLSGFTVWLDPFGGELNYEIIDGTSLAVVFIGSVAPISIARPKEEKSLNVSFAGNVVEVDIPYVPEWNGWILPLANQRFDG